jgi:hypothetical protein
VSPEASATLVWLTPEAPNAEQRAALAAWAQARGVLLTLPGADPAPLETNGQVADLVENEVERARDELAARNAEAVARSLDAAEALLRTHPELPQAAWLMAEVERTRAALWRRVAPLDPLAAARAWSRAQALDGGRVPGIDEDATVLSAAPLATITWVAPPEDEVWVDATLAFEPLGLAAGLHRVVARLSGVPVWADWVDLSPGPSRLEIDAPAPLPCSSYDLRRAKLASERVVVAAGVQCPRWVVAVAPGKPGPLWLATCQASACGSLAPWEPAPVWNRAVPRHTPPPAPPTRPRPWPAWATWALVGAGVALAAGAAAIAATSGAFDEGMPQTRFVNGGLRGP